MLCTVQISPFNLVTNKKWSFYPLHIQSHLSLFLLYSIAFMSSAHLKWSRWNLTAAKWIFFSVSPEDFTVLICCRCWPPVCVYMVIQVLFLVVFNERLLTKGCQEEVTQVCLYWNKLTQVQMALCNVNDRKAETAVNKQKPWEIKNNSLLAWQVKEMERSGNSLPLKPHKVRNLGPFIETVYSFSP